MRSHQPSGVCVLYLVASDLLDVHDVKCCEMHVKCCSTLFDLHFLYHFVRCWARASASLSLVLSWAQWSNSVGHGLALPVKLYQAGAELQSSGMCLREMPHSWLGQQTINVARTTFRSSPSEGQTKPFLFVCQRTAWQLPEIELFPA